MKIRTIILVATGTAVAIAGGLFGAVFAAMATHAWLGINQQYLPALGYVYSTVIVVLAQRLALQAKTADIWALIVSMLPGRRPPP